MDGDNVCQVFLLEDHVAFRRALIWALESEPGLRVVAQAGSLAEGRDLARSGVLEGVDVAVVDLLLPDGSGVEVVKELRETGSEERLLVLTILQDREAHDRALSMGADEVITKDCPIAEIVAAVRRLGERA